MCNTLIHVNSGTSYIYISRALDDELNVLLHNWISFLKKQSVFLITSIRFHFYISRVRHWYISSNTATWSLYFYPWIDFQLLQLTPLNSKCKLCPLIVAFQVEHSAIGNLIKLGDLAPLRLLYRHVSLSALWNRIKVKILLYKFNKQTNKSTILLTQF